MRLDATQTESVYTTIRQMIAGREQARKHPAHVLYAELISATHLDRPTLNAALNTLYMQGVIRVGETLNDKYILAR